MIELGLVVGLLAALVGGGALISRAPWDWLFGGGIAMIALGMLVGVPTGFWYHVRLYKALRPAGPLPKTWWLHPSTLHGSLAPSQRAWVMRPFYAGAVGWVVTVLGCLFTAYGAWRSPPG